MALGAVLLATAACGNQISADARRDQNGNPATATSPAAGTLEASRVRDYVTVAELKSDAEAAVIATATSTRSASDIGGVPFTTTEMSVREVLWGTLANNDTLQLRQLGSTSQQDDDAPVVRSGQTYLIFVRKFVYSSGQDTGEYVVVGGGPGLFEADGQDSFRKLDGLSPKLPARIQRKDAR